MEQFKECYACAKKPGSPQLCSQCLWVRENYNKYIKLKIFCDKIGLDFDNMKELVQIIKEL